MILPYRAKNPPEHFPYVTVALIAINVIVWALTSENFMHITPEALEQFAVSHTNLNLWRLTTAMFLHSDILHISGNMLFLWVFGAAVEGRLRPGRFLLLYFLAGYTGGLLSDVVQGALDPDLPSLGASGAIMGISGAYLYMFPYSSIRVLWLLPLGYLMRFGIANWQARWVVLVYIGQDILFGVLFRSADGVGHFAHIGGFATGLLVCFLFRARSDSAEISTVQATRADVKDYSLLARHELEALLQQPTEDMRLVMAYCEKASLYGEGGLPDQVLAYLNYYGPRLLESEDPNRIAHLLLMIPTHYGGMPPVFYLRLASRLESMASNELAVQVYRRIYDLAPQTQETEIALFRMGQIMQNVVRSYPQAQAAYKEMLRLFPNGQMAFQTRQLLQQIEQQGGQPLPLDQTQQTAPYDRTRMY